jgi:Asp-tRNA(Asn)/Glu-tRNA(Gln) amidotransferase C subunit
MRLANFRNLFGKKVKTPNGNQKMIYVFTSVGGYKYYRFSDTMNQINFERYHGQYTTRLVEMQNRITNASLNEWIETTRGFNNISQYRSAIEALDIRRQIAMDTNMLYELMAVLYLREDEKNEPISNEFLMEKAKDIRDTMIKSEDSEVFFCEPILKDFLKSLNMSALNLNILQQNLESQMSAFRQVMNQIQSKIQPK